MILSKVVVVGKLLRSTLAKFDQITTTLQQFGDFETLTLDEALMSLKVYEEKLQEHQIKKEEKQTLLMHAIETNKDMGENSR